MSIQQPQSERAKSLLFHAQELFLKHGYRATSLQMLIDHSGGSRRNIYAEFGNKEGLFKAVLQQKIGEVNLILAAHYDSDAPKASLIKVCSLFLNKLLEPEMVSLFRLLINTIHDIPDIGHVMYQHALIEGPKGLNSYLKTLNDKGVVQIEDPQHASHLLLGMVKGHLHSHALLDPSFKPSKQQIEVQVQQAVHVFLNGVLQ